MKTKTKAVRRTTNEQILEDVAAVNTGVDVGSPHPPPVTCRMGIGDAQDNRTSIGVSMDVGDPSDRNLDVGHGSITRMNVVGMLSWPSNGITVNEPVTTVDHHQQSPYAASVSGKGKRKLDEIPMSTAEIDIPTTSRVAAPLDDDTDTPSTARMTVPFADGR